MSHVPLRRSFTLIAAAALVVFAVLRVAVLAWLLQQTVAERALLILWGIDTLASLAVLAGLVVACGRLIAGARRQDREHSRVEHLAEVGLLASGLAHEIRNSLNATHSQLALLRKQISAEVDPQACNRAGKVEHALEEVDALLTDFLAFARPAQDRLEEIDVVRLAREVLEFASLDLEQARVAIVTDFASQGPPIYADAGKLRRCLLNLIINARQAMPDGGTLTIRINSIERGEVQVEVGDTGCGIPVEERKRIFEAFFSTKPGGTGLGLAVVRRTIEDCGGRISFESEVGRGSTFRIQLPTSEPRRRTLEREAQQAETIELGC